MKLKSKLTSALAIVMVGSFFFFPRKSVAMDLASQPAVTEVMPKEEGASTISQLVRVTITPIETPNTSKETQLPPQEADPERIAAFSGSTQDLSTTLAGSTSLLPQQSNPCLSAAAQSVSARRTSSMSRLTSSMSGLIAQPQNTSFTRERSPSLESSVKSEYLSGSSILSTTPLEGRVACCGVILPGVKVVAGKRPAPFDLPTAQAKTGVWNDAINTGVQDIHKPQPLGDLEEYSEKKKQSIFGASEPLYVFSQDCKDRIKKYVQNLADSPRKGKGKAPVDPTVEINYDTKTLIFDDTVPKGHYIKAFTFIDEYTKTKNTKSARDNRNHKLWSVILKDENGQVVLEGQVLPETSKIHLSTGHPKSSTHADAYMRKNEYWANIGDISNHTGIARIPTNARKVVRTAT